MTQNISSVENRDAVIEVHIAEYEALMERNTFTMFATYSILPIVIWGLEIVAQVWDRFDYPFFGKRGLLWTVALVVQMFAVASIQLQFQMYTSVRYIETTLRPLLRKQLKTNRFWQYERKVAARRSRYIPQSWEWGKPGIVIVGLVALIAYLWPLSASDWGFVLANVLALTYVLRCSIRVIKLRVDFFGTSKRAAPGPRRRTPTYRKHLRVLFTATLKWIRARERGTRSQARSRKKSVRHLHP